MIQRGRSSQVVDIIDRCCQNCCYMFKRTDDGKRPEFFCDGARGALVGTHFVSKISDPVEEVCYEWTAEKGSRFCTLEHVLIDD